MSSLPPILQAPAAIRTEIADYLDPKSLVNLGRTCTAMRSIADSNVVWNGFLDAPDNRAKEKVSKTFQIKQAEKTNKKIVRVANAFIGTYLAGIGCYTLFHSSLCFSNRYFSFSNFSLQPGDICLNQDYCSSEVLDIIFTFKHAVFYGAIFGACCILRMAQTRNSARATQLQNDLAKRA